MTAISISEPKATSLLCSLDKSNKSEILKSFKFSYLERNPDLDLIEDVIDFSKNSNFYNKIIDLVTIYRCLIEMRENLYSLEKQKCNVVIDDLEKIFNDYLNTGVIPTKSLEIKRIFEPVVKDKNQFV